MRPYWGWRYFQLAETILGMQILPVSWVLVYQPVYSSTEALQGKPAVPRSEVERGKLDQ